MFLTFFCIIIHVFPYGLLEEDSSCCNQDTVEVKGKIQKVSGALGEYFHQRKTGNDPFSKARAVSFLCKTQLKRRIP